MGKNNNLNYSIERILVEEVVLKMYRLFIWNICDIFEES